MKKIKSLLLISFIIVLPFLNFGQPDPRLNGNGTGVGNTPVGGPTGSPIDGGISILLTLGVGYAAKKFLEMRKATT
jgi:hypothetical protein